ncbi:HEAT repeat-containing protein [Toxoplasma gondii]|uniref:HEAT repeat-containing protein n=1 Tax=Toxoplasma gondii TaxID=5811 RepID=A0A7J6K9A8_TOXGO|nr:HEAT repeat-containing protein [Toxoplasma gondii]
MFSLSRDSASAALSAGSQAGHPGELLSPQILRALGDKSQEKRKAAAHEVEALVRRLVHRRAEAAARLQSRVEAPSQSVSSPPRARTETGASGREEAARARGLRDRARLCETQQSEEAPVAAQIEAEDAKLLHIVAVLDKEFLLQGLPNHRKGGLVALASVAIALEAQVSPFLPFLLPPLLRAFSDPEPRVRYYACEALYNVLKVAQTSALPFLNDIFDGICKLYGDVDLDVRGGVVFVDRLLKEIFVSASGWAGKEEFLLLLVKRCRVKSPFIKLLALSWISLLDSVPETDMLQHLQLFLESLFEMLGDTNRDIRHAADACIAGLLEDVKASGCETEVTVLTSVARIVLRCLRSRESFSRLTALVWLHAILSLALHPAPAAAASSSPTAETLSDNRQEVERRLKNEKRRNKETANEKGSGRTQSGREGMQQEAADRDDPEEKEGEEDGSGEDGSAIAAKTEDNVKENDVEGGDEEEDENHKRHLWQMALQRELEPLFPQIVDSVLQCVADREEEIRRLALQNHQHLLFKMLTKGFAFDVRQVVYVLVFHLDLHAPSAAFGASTSLAASPEALSETLSPSREASRVVRLLCLQWLLLLLLEHSAAIFAEDLDVLVLRAALVALRFAERETEREAGLDVSPAHAAPLPQAFARAAASPAVAEEGKGSFGDSRRNPGDLLARRRRRWSANTGESLWGEAGGAARLARHSGARRQRKISEREDEEISHLALQIIAQLTDEREGVFNRLVDLLLDFFQAERRMMETRGREMLRRLCDFLRPRRLYESVAASLAQRTRLIYEAALGCERGEAWKEVQQDGDRADGELTEQATSECTRRGESEGDTRTEGRMKAAEKEEEKTQQSEMVVATEKERGSLGFDDRLDGKEKGEGVCCAAETLQFMHQVVQVFNWILLSAAETQELREEMLQDPDAKLFRRLLPAWMHNPVATLALSLRMRQHRLALTLVQRLATIGNLPLQVYVQLDQLVLLFESPAFVSVRLLLLRPQEHPDLVQALLGLSLLLPQNGAYELLHRRLSLLACSAASSLSPSLGGFSSASATGQQSLSATSGSGQLQLSEEPAEKKRQAEAAFVNEACDWFDRIHLLHSVAVSLEDAHAALPAPYILDVFLSPSRPSSPDGRASPSRLASTQAVETEGRCGFEVPQSTREAGEGKTARGMKGEGNEKEVAARNGATGGDVEAVERTPRVRGEAACSFFSAEERGARRSQEMKVKYPEEGGQNDGGVDKTNDKEGQKQRDRSNSRDGGAAEAAVRDMHKREDRAHELDTSCLFSEYAALSDVATLERNDQRSLSSSNASLKPHFVCSGARERSASGEKATEE